MFTEKHLLKNLFDKKTVYIGKTGEQEAARILKKRGYKIIEKNYFSRYGEIDIIARDGEYTCFVEVRLRKSNDYGAPIDTIDIKKQRRIIKTAQIYAMKNNLADTPMRFDVVAINGEIKNGKIEILREEVIQNAFEIQRF